MQFLNSNIEIAGFTSNSAILFKSLCELVENAIDACEDKDEGLIKIVIEDTKQKSYYKLTVTDNGVGMSPTNAINLCTTVFESSKASNDGGNFGKYGIGLKASQIASGGLLSVVTTEKGSNKIVNFNVNYDREEKCYRMRNYRILPKERVDFSGTEIRINPIIGNTTSFNLIKQYILLFRMIPHSYSLCLNINTEEEKSDIIIQKSNILLQYSIANFFGISEKEVVSVQDDSYDNKRVTITNTIIHSTEPVTKCEIRIYRYCNSIPLMLKYHNGLIYQSFMNIQWHNYGLHRIELNSADLPFISFTAKFDTPTSIAKLIFVFNIENIQNNENNDEKNDVYDDENKNNNIKFTDLQKTAILNTKEFNEYIQSCILRLIDNSKCLDPVLYHSKCDINMPLLFSQYIPAVSHSVSSIIMSSKNEMFKRKCMEYINRLSISNGGGSCCDNLPEIIQQSLLQMLKYKDPTSEMEEEEENVKNGNEKNKEKKSEFEPSRKRRKLKN